MWMPYIWDGTGFNDGASQVMYQPDAYGDSQDSHSMDIAAKRGVIMGKHLKITRPLTTDPIPIFFQYQ